MLRLAQERERLTVIDDQWGTPTGADLLADVTAHAIRHLQQRPEDGGLYHCVASGETNWHLYAKEVLALAAQAQPAIKIKATEVAPVPTSAFPTAATRPHNSRLNTGKLQSTFGLALPHWQGRFTPRDYAALTPLIWEHVNPYGRFDLDMNTRLDLP